MQTSTMIAETSKMPTPNELHGQCFCGHVQVRVQKALQPPVNCHCGQCRRLSGAAFTTWFSINRDALVIDGQDALSTFHPTQHLTRQFCKFCGSHVMTLDRRQPVVAGLHAGTFEGQELPGPKADYFASHKANWYDLPLGSNCFGGETGFDPLPL
jgi:hypothetical protein